MRQGYDDEEGPLVTDVDLSEELLGGLDGAGGSDDLTASDLFTLDATEESTHVVTSLSLSGRSNLQSTTKCNAILTRSSSLWNISIPVRVVCKLEPKPTTSTSVPLVATPRSTWNAGQ